MEAPLIPGSIVRLTHLADKMETDTMKYTKILSNKVQCKKCNEIVESKHRHDFR
jgi:hypothetical protein